MSTGAYAPDKILAHPHRLQELRKGQHPAPVHLHLILSDLCNLDCPGCFPPGALVLTSEGYLPIEEVEEGMRVFSHDGKLHAVTKTMPHHHKGKTVAFRVERLGGEFLQTDNHPFLTHREGMPTGWRRADDLRVGDEVAIRLPNVPTVSEIVVSRVLDGLSPVEERPGHVRARGGKTTCPDRVPLNWGFGELVGAYLGDGHVQRVSDRPGSYEVSFGLGAHQHDIAERLAVHTSEIFGLRARIQPRPAGSTIEVAVGSSIVGRLLLALCGTGSHDKQVHPALHGASREFVEGLIRGYAWTDGCVDDKSFTTVSKPLALTIYQLALRAGLSPTMFETPGRPSLIKGRAIHAIGPRYTIRFRGEDRALFDRIVGLPTEATSGRNWKPMEEDAEGYYWLRVKSTETYDYDGPVFNFEVEGTHSFIANGLVTHNCAYRMPGYPSSELFVQEKEGGGVNRNPARFLDTELVKSVLEDCAMMGTHAIEFTGGGEPTLHKDAESLIDYAQCLGLDTALITNGIMLHHVGDPAVRTKWLRISLDAACAETYMRVRPSHNGGRALLYARVIENIRWAVEMKKVVGSDCTIGIGFVVQERNWHEIFQATELAYNIGADNIRLSGLFTPSGEAYHAAYRAQAEKLEARAIEEFDGKRGFRVYGRFHEKLEDLHARPDYERCWYQRVTTYLGADANLYRCCVTSYNKLGLIGNVKEAGGLRKLWESDQARRAFDLFDARTCERCQFNDRNRAIDAAVRAPTLPAVPQVQHANFV